MITGLSQSDVAMLRQMAAEFRKNNPNSGTTVIPRQPTILKAQDVKIGKTKTDVISGNSVVIEIYRQDTSGQFPVNTGEEITANLDWLSSETISSGKEVMIQRFPDEGLWRIVGAECE